MKACVRNSGRIYLRPLARGDYASYRDLLLGNSDWLARWSPSPAVDHGTKAAFRREIRWSKSEAKKGTTFRLGIFAVAGDRLGGMISLSGIHRGALWSAYAGYWVGREFAGRGLAPEALCLVFDFAFHDLALHRIQIAIMPSNAASLRVVEKLGLREEGFAKRYLKIAGAWEDHRLFAILSEEFQERKRELFERFVHGALAAGLDAPMNVEVRA